MGTARGREKRAANDVRPGGAWDDATDGSGDGPLDEPGEPVVAAAPAEAAGAMSLAEPSPVDEARGVAPARNEVVLVGRVAAEPEERALPSGDVIVTWRLVVDRPPGLRTPPPGVRASTVDTLDCVAWADEPKRSALALAPGDVARLEGALRRRFWRSGAGAASRCEVEVSGLRRLGPAPGRAVAGAGAVRRPSGRAAPDPSAASG